MQQLLILGIIAMANKFFKFTLEIVCAYLESCNIANFKTAHSFSFFYFSLGMCDYFQKKNCLYACSFFHSFPLCMSKIATLHGGIFLFFKKF